MPKVSVIIPVYNYGRYVKQAIDSVLRQRFLDYEVIVVNDCSTDNTDEVLKEFADNPKIRIITHKENQGFIRSCHEAIELSQGKYIIRVDADDYLDENALLALSNVLDADPKLGLVYSDYITVSAESEIIDYIRLPRINNEVELLDIPANGAMMMFRKSCYKAVGGYDLSLDCQDGYDLWLKFRGRFGIDNINLPLFYYRRHGENFGEDSQRILKARRYIKQRQVTDEGILKPSVLGLIPARVHDYCDYLVLKELGGKPLLTCTAEEATKTSLLERVVVTTEDNKIAMVAKELGVDVILHPPQLAQKALQHATLHVLRELNGTGYRPDAVAILPPYSPFRKAEHIAEAINTMLLFEVDSVISVCQDLKVHYQHKVHGMSPLFGKKPLHQEKEALYEENGAIFLCRADAVTESNLMGGKVGHIIMTREESVRIDSEFDFWLAEQIVRRNHISF